MNKIFYTLACTYLTFTLNGAQPLHASESSPPEHTLDPVVVTAKRTPTPLSVANANVIVISNKELAREHYATLIDALRSAPGVNASQYGNGVGFSQYNPFMLNGSDKYVILIDGIRANTNGSPFSSFDFGTIPIETIERIEILKGASSTLYGADAKGGVINIITRAPRQTKTSLTMQADTFGGETYRLHHEETSEQYAWSVHQKKQITGDYTDGSGRETPSHSNVSSQNIKITRYLSPDADITFAYQNTQADYAYTVYNAAQNPLYFSTHDVSPTTLYPYTKKMRASSDTSNVSLTYRAKLSERENMLLSLYQNHTDATYDLHKNDVPWLMDIETFGINHQYTNQINEKHTLVGGFDYYQDRVNHFQDLLNVYGNKSIANTAFYIQDDWKMGDDWTLTGGMRYDDNTYSGGNLSSALTLGYQQDKSTQYYVSYREHFVSPHQYQLFGPYKNTGLKPETGKTYEFGISQKFSQTAAMKASLFHRRSHNTILYDTLAEQYINVGEETANGYDMQLTKRFSPAWQFFAGYTYTSAKTKKNETADSMPIDLPKQEFTLSLVYTKDDWNASLNGHGIFDRPNNWYAEQSYWVWSTTLNYKINPSAQAYIKINNLFDQFYSERANKMNLGWEDWYAAPGRSYQFGITYTI